MQPIICYVNSKLQAQPQQQQYQNHDELTNGNNDELHWKVSCMMYERDYEELIKAADLLRNDIRELADELNVIQKRTPEYFVDVEAKI